MFFYPDPEPIGHCITDVSPSYLTDGVFFNGRSVGPTHKRVAKQLSAVPRGPNDPVVPRAQVSPRTLERWCVDSRAMHVDNCGRNARALHGMMSLLPREKVDPYAGWKSKVAVFPRSEQYEYSYIREMTIKASENLGDEEEMKKCREAEMSQSGVSPAFEYTKSPIWWKDKIPIRVQCAVGHPDDYQIRLPDAPNIRNPIKPKADDPRAYVPGVIYGQTNPSRKDVPEENEDRTDTVEGEGEGEGEGHGDKDAGNCDCSLYTNHKSPRRSTEEGNESDKKNEIKISEVDPVAQYDPRWLQVDKNYVPRNCEERNKIMSNVKRPYLHEINTWYYNNKPTKLIPTLTSVGKRPILEWHFSNL